MLITEMVKSFSTQTSFEIINENFKIDIQIKGSYLELSKLTQNNKVDAIFYTWKNNADTFLEVFPQISKSQKTVQDFLKFVYKNCENKLNGNNLEQDEYMKVKDFYELVETLFSVDFLNKHVGKVQYYVLIAGKIITSQPYSINWLNSKELFEEFSSGF